MQGLQVRSLVRELKSYMLCSAVKKKKIIVIIIKILQTEFISCLYCFLGRVLNFSVLQFPCLKNGHMIVPIS